MRSPWIVVALPALLFVACHGAPDLAPDGAACRTASECESGVCEDAVCMEACTGESECSSPGAVCAAVAYGGSYSRYCVATCEGSYELDSEWYCADGIPTACADGGAENACDQCGCSGGTTCDLASGACRPPRAVGEPCYRHEDCASNNCGAVGGAATICFDAPGSTCDGSTCGACVALTDGSTQCLQSCSDSSDCPGYRSEYDGTDASQLCWGNDEDGYYCRAECTRASFPVDDDCPDGFECREVRDRDYRRYNRCYPDRLVPGSASVRCPTGTSADGCGTCDADPTNDCVQDCAGTWGGAATMDLCGTCDSDPANDCVTDCTGVPGGPALLDRCGTCDEDPTNDCRCDPCDVCDLDPTNDCVPSCPGGLNMLGACWYWNNAIGGTCTQECAERGGTYSDQTRYVAGSSGTADACYAIGRAWLGPTTRDGPAAATAGGIGCALRSGIVEEIEHHTATPTTAGASGTGGAFTRFCACQF